MTITAGLALLKYNYNTVRKKMLGPSEVTLKKNWKGAKFSKMDHLSRTQEQW